jgi:ferredoxin
MDDDAEAPAAALFLDRKRCAATRTCVGIAPALFEYGPGPGASRVRQEIVRGPTLIGLAREAEESCPMEAIRVVTE